jgi:hypothetical protein
MMFMVVLCIYLFPAALWFFWPGHLSQWRWWEFLCLLVPFVLWLVLSLLGGKAQSMVNAIIEPFICGILAYLPIIFKSVSPRFGWRPTAWFYFGLFLSCSFVLVTYFAVPPLSE